MSIKRTLCSKIKISLIIYVEALNGGMSLSSIRIMHCVLDRFPHKHSIDEKKGQNNSITFNFLDVQYYMQALRSSFLSKMEGPLLTG